MKRTITFDTGQNREAFPLLYQGLLNGGNGPSAKGIQTLRTEVRILDKLDAISEPEYIEVEGAKVATDARLLKDGPQSLTLEQPEFDLLKRYFENTPWTTRVARQVVNIVDWLATIPEDTDG